MAYSETRIVIGGLAHVPVLIFIANFIKGKFVIKTEKAKETLVHEEPVKIIEVKDTVFFTWIILSGSPFATASFVSSVLISNLP